MGGSSSNNTATQPATLVEPTQQAPTNQPQPNPGFNPAAYQRPMRPQQAQGPAYTVDAWGRSQPVQTGFTPAFQNNGYGAGGYFSGGTYGGNNVGYGGSNVAVGDTYNVGNGATSGYQQVNQAQLDASAARERRTNNTPTRFNGAPISESNPGMIPWKYDAMNNPFAIHDPQSYDRYNAGIPGFVPGAAVLNNYLGWGQEETPERRAERLYNQRNPGQSDNLGNRYFGTGKWETVHPTDVTHTQSYGDNRRGYGDNNESGLGRDTNYDRFGNMRTEIPADIASGNYYWNSTTRAWTDKKTGIPVGGSINDPNSTPAADKAKAIDYEATRERTLAAANAQYEKDLAARRDKDSKGTAEQKAANRAQLQKKANDHTTSKLADYKKTGKTSGGF